ncbi:MAG: transposase [Acidobacteria bacterium]|nr:transposase [Acidobacteriota bacterium]
MGTTYRPYQPKQTLLLPPSLKEWLPEGHLAYFIGETVDLMDLSDFFKHYEGDGRRNQPFHPRMMVKILLYGYATGVFSSRKLARKMTEDVAFQVLAAGNFPAHRTIAEFRQRHLIEVKANASKRKAMTDQRMSQDEKELEQEIAELLEEAARRDAQEDALYGPENSGDELPEELRRREQRLVKIKAAKQRLERRQEEEDRAQGRHEGDNRKSPRGGRDFKREFGEVEKKKQDNFTDPESRIMKTSTEGFQQSYNTQIAVDEGSQLIVATGMTSSAADNGQLMEMVEEVKSVTGIYPERVLADSGYRGEDNFLSLEKESIDGYIAQGREGKEDQSPSQGPASERMFEKLRTTQGRAHYSRRKAIVEPVFGWIKEAVGFRRFSLRSLEKVSAEWDLVCTAINLKHLNATVCWL